MGASGDPGYGIGGQNGLGAGKRYPYVYGNATVTGSGGGHITAGAVGYDGILGGDIT